VHNEEEESASEEDGREEPQEGSNADHESRQRGVTATEEAERSDTRREPIQA
jgi:hypothetical protein